MEIINVINEIGFQNFTLAIMAASSLTNTIVLVLMLLDKR